MKKAQRELGVRVRCYQKGEAPASAEEEVGKLIGLVVLLVIEIILDFGYALFPDNA